ncbi:alpha/beta hydrolase [Aerosakkonemataceae cyanobacterium BLCC-F50]|uniref:Alpha/beta hydrolase n=1 Tax=Floridaenema flaviceps BLCC-F50 TaxID=3153642 RepID=A0ABV4Y4A7_9CYAN
MTRKRIFLLTIALLSIAFSWWGVATAQNGLVVRSFSRDNVPMVYVAPKNQDKIPGVLVAHGFAGSKQLMLGYAHTLAHTGYGVLLWDFGGHGANATPLKFDSLQKYIDVATAALLDQPQVDAARLASLGHSMGSGAVISAAMKDSQSFAATVAVSPTGRGVTPATPRNLQLQAGSWEPGFVKNAEKLLQAAGGENQNLAAGKGRELIIVPNAEHITILFRDESHQAARKWLDATFGLQSDSKYLDRRMLFYGLHLLGWLILLAAIAPKLNFNPNNQRVSWLRSFAGLLVAPFVASGLLSGLEGAIELESLGGLLVGGALGVWFFLAGTTWLITIWKFPRPKIQNLLLGLGLFVLLWLAFGAMAQVVWLQWWLIPSRLLVWPILSLACLPWFLASEIVQQNVGIGKRLAWWFCQSILLITGLIVAVSLVPSLSFIYLLLPIFPLVFGILAFAASQVNDAWTYALGSTLFFGWTLAAAFPLAG